MKIQRNGGFAAHTEYKYGGTHTKSGDEMRKSLFAVKSLKEQIYDYLIEQFRLDVFRPGSYFNLDKTSNQLGISQTPLRDAVIQLESEGFVTIEPRRGIFINTFTLNDMRHIYKVIGVLDKLAILESAGRITKQHIDEMAQLNDRLAQTVPKSNMDLFKEKNSLFHEVYANLTCNPFLVKTITTLKKRLYYFPYRGEKMIPEWANSSIKEHEKIVDFLRNGKFAEAADYIQNVHWSFENQERYIRMHYTNISE